MTTDEDRPVRRVPIIVLSAAVTLLPVLVLT
jgi:hypothetical protein